MAQISIIKKSDIENNLRIGAQTYHLSKLNNINVLKNYFGKNKIIDFFDFIKKAVPISEIQKKEKVKLLELESISNFSIKNIVNTNSSRIQSNKYISQKNDVVISRLRPYLKQVGYIEEQNILTTTELNILRSKKNNIKLSKYLYFYLTTSLVQTILFWSQEGTNHPRFPLYILENLPFNIPNDLEYFENIFNIAHQKQAQSKKLYKEAEQLLLEELGLVDYQPKNILTFETTKKEVEQATRFDAEYFQPKAKKLRTRFEAGNSIKVKDAITQSLVSGSTPKARGNDYEENGKIKFIRAVNLKDLKIDYTDSLFIKEHIHNKTLKRSQLKVADVLFSIAGVIGRCAVVKEDIGQANINQALAIIRLNTKLFDPYYVALFFTSKYGNQYVNDISRPVAQTNLNLTELSNIHIPLLPIEIQKQIADKIKESHKLRKESKELLEEAKRKVEEEIEKE